MLLQLNQTVSYGIPVGPSASRLLAEIAIADVDAALRSEGFVHTRFVDDFRIFCKTERDAFSALAFLANTLFDHHGLTLQQHKTFIQTSAKFIANNSATESDNERESLSARFQSILNKIGINNPYETLEYEDVDSQTKADIDALNLSGILREQIDSNEQLDIPMTKFVLKRLTQLSDDQVVDVILANIRRLYPVFKECLLYLTSVRSGPFDDRHEFGERLLNLISHDVVGHLEFHRAWILSAFADDGDWGNAERFVPIYNQFSDSLTRREAILALGRSGQSAWFKGKKKQIGNFDPWQRRAFLAAASCLPGDESTHWYRAVVRQLDELDWAVIDWVLRHPFR